MLQPELIAALIRQEGVVPDVTGDEREWTLVEALERAGVAEKDVWEADEAVRDATQAATDAAVFWPSRGVSWDPLAYAAKAMAAEDGRAEPWF